MKSPINASQRDQILALYRRRRETMRAYNDADAARLEVLQEIAETCKAFAITPRYFYRVARGVRCRKP